MSWPGYCFFNALVMTATLSSEVQKRMDGVLQGKMTFTQDRSWYRVRLFAHRPCHLASMKSEEHTSELQSLIRISYAVFCLKKKKIYNKNTNNTTLNSDIRISIYTNNTNQN